MHANGSDESAERAVEKEREREREKCDQRNERERRRGGKKRKNISWLLMKYGERKEDERREVRRDNCIVFLYSIKVTASVGKFFCLTSFSPPNSLLVY